MEESSAESAYRQQLFEVVQDPRFPGVEKWKQMLGPTAEFKKQLVDRGLVKTLNKLYGWRLAEDGKWNTQQANDVMFDIVAKPGFDVGTALAALTSGRKP
jgi:hypothetical protein